ncbi:MAG TPA: hypothetical protein VM597_27320 [Gemmataceae bacterium]|jgi:hypothetical protein|nr:hypothetical protein [Gemmataceae bacterium]
MWPPKLTRFALTVALCLALGARVLGQNAPETPPAIPEPADENGFSWLCFLTAIAVLVGLYVVIHRRERAVEATVRTNGRPETAWYCRACDRDVTGPACPNCHAPNPFLDSVAAGDALARRNRTGHRAKGRFGERR